MYLVELRSNGRGSTLCDKRLVSYERKLTFHEISFGPMMSRFARIVTALGPQKNVVFIA